MTPLRPQFHHVAAFFSSDPTPITFASNAAAAGTPRARGHRGPQTKTFFAGSSVCGGRPNGIRSATAASGCRPRKFFPASGACGLVIADAVARRRTGRRAVGRFHIPRCAARATAWDRRHRIPRRRRRLRAVDDHLVTISTADLAPMTSDRRGVRSSDVVGVLLDVHDRDRLTDVAAQMPL